MKIIQQSDAKNNFATYAERVRFNKESFLVERYGKPFLVMSPVEGLVNASKSKESAKKEEPSK